MVGAEYVVRVERPLELAQPGVREHRAGAAHGICSLGTHEVQVDRPVVGRQCRAAIVAKGGPACCSCAPDALRARQDYQQLVPNAMTLTPLRRVPIDTSGDRPRQCLSSQ